MRARKAVDTVDKKKAKIMFQKCRYDNNKLTKIWSKKVKIRARKGNGHSR